MKNFGLRKNLHLVLSTVIVVPAALSYGLFPSQVLPILLDFEVDSTDLKNVFRAIMGLYLGMAALWILGVVKPVFWKASTIINILFMAGLVMGRLVSMIVDGIPSAPFAVGILGEAVLAIFAYFQLRIHGKKING